MIRCPDDPIRPRTFLLMRLKIFLRPLRPPQRHLHRLPSSLPLRRMLRALVKGHYDVGAQRDLYLHRALRSKQMRGAVKMRTKTDSFLRHLAQLAQAEDLEAAGISQQRAVPAHEAVQPAQLAHQLMSRPKIEMVGIAKNDLRSQLFNDVLRNGLDRACGAHGHKGRRFDITVRGKDARQARGAGLGLNSEGKDHVNMLQVFAKTPENGSAELLRSAQQALFSII